MKIEISNHIHAPHSPQLPHMESIRTQQSFSDILKGLSQEPRSVDALLPKVKGEYQDLIKAQVEVSRYSLRVELVSKAAESASSSFKRLQQG